MKEKLSSKLLIIILLIISNGLFSQTEIVSIDFGESDSGLAETPSPWNNIEDRSTTGSIINLINSNSNDTGIDLNVTDDFNGLNEGGTTTPNAGLNLPTTATQDSFFGSSSNSGSIELNNLVVGKDYTLTFFASRMNVSDIREATYTAIGSTTQSVSLNASENEDSTVSITLTPTTDGIVTINITTGSNNDNPDGYFYLNSLELEYETETPLFSDYALLVDFGSSSTQSVTPWNNITDNSIDGEISDLLHYSGDNSGISMNIISAFNYINGNGTRTAGESLDFVSSVTRDSFGGNDEEFNGNIVAESAIEFNNFDSNDDLTITIYGSREDYSTIDNRETKYIIQGATTETLYLNVKNNRNISVSTTVKPAADGKLTVTLSPGPNNDNIYGFFYIGGLKIEYTPSTLSTFTPKNEKFSINVYPNPIKETSSLNINSNLNGTIKMSFYNMLGKELYNSDKLTISKGENIIPLNLDSLTNSNNEILMGVFTIETDEGIFQEKIKLISQ